jgi:hypothetical protein
MVTAAAIALPGHRSEHEADRRSPEYRLRQFFDHGTLRWLHSPDGSGVQADDGEASGQGCVDCLHNVTAPNAAHGTALRSRVGAERHHPRAEHGPVGGLDARTVR